jgi:type II secretory ATPase GspE/PulE/Tfp pilus assembly ATPase PilB-like protein
MNPFLYVNLVYWLIAVVGLLMFARFAVFVSKDVATLSTLPELLWRVLPLSVLFLMVFVFFLLPYFFVGLFVNILLAGGVIGWYWMLRVKELGAAGHLFSGTIRAAKSVSSKRKDARAASQVELTYLRPDDSKMPLPSPDDPVAAGLSIMDQLMIRALERHAETIDMTPSVQGYDLRMIIDGIPYPQAPMGRNVAEPVVTALKSLADLQIEDRRRPQQGVFKVRDSEGVITVWTIRTSGTTAGEKLSLSSNEKGKWDRSLEQLGLAADQLAAIKDVAKDNQGIVIVATPRGSGRTTTLYSLLRMHDAFVNSVQTVEINPQSEIEGVTVNRFDPRTPDANMAKLINSVCLKDPNVVMIAQIADNPSAELLAKYAEFEHRVYVGWNAFDTMAALEQWMAMVTNKRQAAESLRAVISQRLARVLCPTCRIPYQPDAATLQRLNLPVGRNLQSFKANTEPLRDPKGNPVICPDCGGTGYRGRTGVFEVLIITAEMRKALAENSLQQVRALARKNNMMLLVEHGIRKFASGVTSIQEVLRVVTPEKGAPPAASSGIHPAQK